MKIDCQPSGTSRILLVDAYDSFSESIAALLQQSLDVLVVRITIDAGFEDEILDSATSWQHSGERVQSFENFLQQFSCIVIGPGPGNPSNMTDVGIIPIIWSIAKELSIPIMGICLGFQYLCLAHCLPITQLPIPCHGQAKKLVHLGSDIFEGVEFEILVTNYNSLGVRLAVLDPKFHKSSSTSKRYQETTVFRSADVCTSKFPPEDLLPLSWDKDGWLMAARHKYLPFWGLQFHPESCKSSTFACRQMIRNWWRLSQCWNEQFRWPNLNLCTSDQHHSPESRTKKASRVDSSQELDHFKISSLPIGQAEKPPSSGFENLFAYLIELSQVSSSGLITQSVAFPFPTGGLTEYCCQRSTQSVAILESAARGRYSIFALTSPNSYTLEASQNSIKISSESQPNRTFSNVTIDILELLRAVLGHLDFSKGSELIPFWGGYIGFLSYEYGLRNIGVKPLIGSDHSTIPEASFLWVERSIVLDHVRKRAFIQSTRVGDAEWVKAIAADLSALALEKSQGHVAEQHFAERSFPLTGTNLRLPEEASYKSRISECQEQLRAGNSYELCLTTEARVEVLEHQTLNLYLALKHVNPAPFSAYLKLCKTKIVSSSPEQFLKWDRHGTIEMLPMKGTVAKSINMNLEKAASLLASQKESAENLMITDLIRHDLYRALGRNANVEVVKLCEVVECETVYQLISQIRSSPPSQIHDLPWRSKRTKVIQRGTSVLKQSMPPGSMTGAPKKRSCEILTDLEQRSRGVYAGVLGFLDIGGGGSFSVCIRTAFSTNDNYGKNGNITWRIGAGGAITVLSNPDDEWEEMKAKMDSVLRAFGSHSNSSYS